LLLRISLGRNSADGDGEVQLLVFEFAAPPNEGFPIGQGEPTGATPSSPLSRGFSLPDSSENRLQRYLAPVHA